MSGNKDNTYKKLVLGDWTIKRMQEKQMTREKNGYLGLQKVLLVVYHIKLVPFNGQDTKIELFFYAMSHFVYISSHQLWQPRRATQNWDCRCHLLHTILQTAILNSNRFGPFYDT